MRSTTKNVPVIMQMEASECGAICLAMMLAYYGRWVPLEEARVACGVSRDGSKEANIAKAGESYGLAATTNAYSIDELREKASFPCIASWKGAHFVVVKGISGSKVLLNDPSRGSVKVPLHSFERSYGGTVLAFEPTSTFEKGGQRPSTWAFTRRRLRGMKAPIAFVAVATFVLSLATILSTTVSTAFMDYVLSGEIPQWFGSILTLLSIAVVVRCAVSIANAAYLNCIRGKFAVVGASEFMWHLLHLPVGFYEQRAIGDLQQRQEANETVAATLVERLAPALFNVVLLVLYLGVMLAYSWKLTLVGVGAVAVNVIVANWASRARVNVSRQQMRSRGLLYSSTMAGIESIETIKASGAEEGFFERWSGYQALVNNASVRFSKVDLYFAAVPEFLAQFANIAVLLLGTFLIMSGQFTAGMLMAFQGLLASFMGPVDSVIGLGQQIQEMRTSMERVQDVLEHPADASESTLPAADVNDKLSGKVEIEHLSFGYSPLEPALIKDFSLSLEPGSWVALVGSSGSGKSTIAKLVSGLYEPWQGSIKFDGMPRSAIDPDRLHASLSVVDQDIMTVPDTIDANIRLWDQSIEEYEVIMAARDAGIHDAITQRAAGYQEVIAPRGRNFSGGQLQRLEIARALAADPSILILDEATSALDAKTEAHIMQSVRERGITCIVVAHRLSTIRDCDEIIVLHEGTIVERGTHDQLIAANGTYANLVRSN
ncbi:ABC transporter [Denitrobacterium detoxificans]|uniref:NHLM bacteriocin system ABC transporter, peptidase/ATP-binding protein n=1 Tax=Denitrobacterium detoxificans TaxID=79604 RepID=A0A172RY87_9ACTN|nr:NHLP family bacteriocin export ABC transporter peptidase/permease/ATPase subunit [Denitrobacterium detoxificans]ANE22679.1 ABC transporter [Denitrobacterium detoxificans]SEO86856.1 NHLM bacteriocin system ABC transporter, peptidase/ATP-binding protein [Denitrobacterium detoxificans]